MRYSRVWLLLCCVLILFTPVSASDDQAQSMEETLRNTVVRVNDSLQTSLQFGLTDVLPPLNLTPPPAWLPGLRQDFKVIQVSGASTQRITAQVVYKGSHVVFWIDIRALTDLSAGSLRQMERFDRLIYPEMHAIFGVEESPGIDNDPRIHAIFTTAIGDDYLGYFSAQDTQDPRVCPTSNGMDLFFLNPRLLNATGDAMIDTLSHEFQHMIHHAHDPNETVFLDEGLSGLAEYLSLNTINSGNIHSWLNDTGRSLINWPANGRNNPYYGSAFLFAMYLYDRLGAELIRQIVASPENGLDSIDAVLKNQTGSLKNLTADALYAEWLSAVFLNLLGIPDGAYHYKSFPFPLKNAFIDIDELPCENFSALYETAQYGMDLFSLHCSQGVYELRFQGQPQARLTSLARPEDGRSAWWSNAVNNSVTTLTRGFDLRHLSPPIHFTYEINYDIEQAYDFLYLLISQDNGKSWQILKTPSGTDENRSGQNLGFAYTSSSGGWLQESVDLSAYAGRQIRLQFSYITDTASISQGALIDALALDTAADPDAAEAEQSSWQADGFVRSSNSIPQRWLNVSMEENAAADGVQLSRPRFSWSDGEIEMIYTCDMNRSASGCYFAVSPISRYALTRSGYRLSITRVE